ncbi:hypothetical protein [Arsenicicoccus piscis]|uniref:Capsular polysaccharide biosynthesis protein n=1 Tax=Arsenicicoccus piscis TaxID=673954 RepID=A0ABQ6HR58_9MICO|nr:hypothetical protein [Arsenicicoccus piscis]GMA20583.1 hypothetical protein GCM10025862_26040 [Arsenicicoccus piscis]
MTVACLVGGLLLGLLVAGAVASTSKPTYSATTNFAVLPGTRSTGENLGQVAFLTPVFAAQANDPNTAAEVKKDLGGRAPATSVPQTYPDSQLLFTISSTGDDPELVFKTAQAFERVMLARAAAGQPVGSEQARLAIVAHAQEPTASQSLSPKVLYAAGGLAGLLVGAALALGLARRREGDQHTPGHAG